MSRRRLMTLLVTVAAVVAAVVIAVPASAGGGPVTVSKLTDFYTSALQGDGSFQWVHCSQATRVVKKDGSAVEEYECALSGWVDGVPAEKGGPLPNIFGDIVYPNRAMRFADETGFFYFSDFIYITTGQVVYASSWREQLTPSGQVHFKAVYDPA